MYLLGISPKKLVVVPIVFVIQMSFAQEAPKEYFTLIEKADSLYHTNSPQQAAHTYTRAFKSNGWMGYIPDLYSAAKAWAKIGNLDSAFRKLDRVVTYANHRDFKDYKDFHNEPAFKSLYQDARWKELLRRAEERFSNPLILRLDTIFQDDQKHRLAIDSVFSEYGADSPEAQRILEKMNETDSINLIKVKEIINNYGWLGREEVGQTGNNTLFLVIQHADSATQVNYLPLMRRAVQDGKAEASQLALLEDRVALIQGREQIYGSQIGVDEETGEHYVLPLIDPSNVDKRRASVGLQPLSEYATEWGIHWNVEDYKKQTEEMVRH